LSDVLTTLREFLRAEKGATTVPGHSVIF